MDFDMTWRPLCLGVVIITKLFTSEIFYWTIITCITNYLLPPWNWIKFTSKIKLTNFSYDILLEASNHGIWSKEALAEDYIQTSDVTEVIKEMAICPFLRSPSQMRSFFIGHPVSVWKLFRGQMRKPRSPVLHPLRKKKNFPFCVMVRKSENNVEYLSSRGAPSGIFLGRHSSCDTSRVRRIWIPFTPIFIIFVYFPKQIYICYIIS